MSCNSIPFSLSEEAFLLNSLHEVTKVWARATGKATFNLSVQDGQAHLQLGFQLGMPGDPHLPPYQPSKPRFKTSVRKERDRVRAAEHQAKIKISKVVGSTTITPTSNSSEVILTTTVSVAASNSVMTATVDVPVISKVRVVPPLPKETLPEADSAPSPVSTEATAATSAATTSLVSTAAASAATSTYHPICPTRPMRPFCKPDEDDQLKELDYFIDDLRVKVRFSDDKLLKVKHKAIVIAFAEKMKKDPEILYKSKNYEKTFLSLCSKEDRHLYLEILGQLV